MRILITCQNCQRRYDVSRYKIGARVRCSCGESMRIRQPKGHDAAVVRCSSCGGPREDGLNHCGFCGSDFTLHEQDLHTICPQCLARVSDRAAFCHACGDRLVAEAMAGEPSAFACPACGDDYKLTSRQLGKERISVAECQRCAGLWISQSSFVHLRDRVAKNAVPAQSLFPPKPAKPRIVQQASGYRRCPQCPHLMNRRQYASGARVVVDVCREHGIWFDDEELTQVVAWIASGGQSELLPEPVDQTLSNHPIVGNSNQEPLLSDDAMARRIDELGDLLLPIRLRGTQPLADFDVVESVLVPLARLAKNFLTERRS